MQLTFILLLGSLVWALLPTVISACRPVNEVPSLAGATVTADVMLAISPFFFFPSLDHLAINKNNLQVLEASEPGYYSYI